MYVKYKNKYGRQGRKKLKTKPMEDFHHDIKKNLLNPEMLNTLQTRKNCYSDIIHQRIKVKEKPVINNEPHVKKPRGRPRKNFEAVSKNQNQPKKLNSTTVNIPNGNKLNNNLKGDDFVFKKPLPVSNGKFVDAYNNNVKNGKQQIMSFSIKTIAKKFWKLFNQDWKYDTEIKQEHSEHYIKKEEGKFDTSFKKDLKLNLEGLKLELMVLLKQLENVRTSYYKNDIKIMLSKLDEKLGGLKPTEPKKNHIHNDPTSGKGKENIHHSIKKNKDETKVNKNEEDFDSDEKYSGKWINGIINDNVMDVEDSTTQDMFENELETLSEDVAQNYNNTVQSHLNNLDLNHIYSPIYECTTCGKYFGTDADWKIHRAEHVGATSKNCLCKTCGRKFRMIKDYLKHMNTHCISKQNKNKKNGKKFKCKKCNKQYNFLALYYSHIKTHV